MPKWSNFHDDFSLKHPKDYGDEDDLLDFDDDDDNSNEDNNANDNE